MPSILRMCLFIIAIFWSGHPANAYWAIAASMMRDGSWGYGTARGYENRSEAEAAALQSCAQRKPNCGVVMTGNQPCFAIAVTKTDNGMGFSGHQSTSEAEDLALSNCQRRNASECELQDVECELEHYDNGENVVDYPCTDAFKREFNKYTSGTATNFGFPPTTFRTDYCRGSPKGMSCEIWADETKGIWDVLGPDASLMAMCFMRCTQGQCNSSASLPVKSADCQFCDELAKYPDPGAGADFSSVAWGTLHAANGHDIYCEMREARNSGIRNTSFTCRFDK